MRNNRLVPIAALVTAGLLWGTTVPLTKLALAWLDPGWLTVARFTLAALLLAGAARRGLRGAMSPAVVACGVFGYGAVIVLHNAGVARTSVSHAALLVGATPALVALLTVGLGRGRVRPLSWIGLATALAGVAMTAGAGGDGATLLGDGLVFAALPVSAAFVVAQPRLLQGRDPVAVTAVQLAAAAVATLPIGVALDGLPAAPDDHTAIGTAIGAVAALAVVGTLLPFTLFAYGQARVAPEIAGAFLNLEPLVGTAVAVLAFGDPFGAAQFLGGSAILAGIAITAAPERGRHRGAYRDGRSQRRPSGSTGVGGAAGEQPVGVAPAVERGRIRRREREAVAGQHDRTHRGQAAEAQAEQRSGRARSGRAARRPDRPRTGPPPTRGRRRDPGRSSLPNPRYPARPTAGYPRHHEPPQARPGPASSSARQIQTPVGGHRL